MLRASHRVLKPGGRICFLVIAVADGLPDEERSAAVDAGPQHVDTERGYPELMAAAGFAHVELVDVTGEYLDTVETWRREWQADSIALKRVVGREGFAERQTNRTKAIEAIADGLLRRCLVTAYRA